MTERPPVDDLAPWAEDDLVRALRAPGTATELADEERYVAAFREAGGPTVRSLPRRAAGRLGAGGTAVVVTVALTSGVAAAYTGHLPDPVQQIAHTVIGAPAPDAAGRHHPDASGPRHVPTAPPSVGPSASSSAGPSSEPSSTSSPPTTSPVTPAGAPRHHGRHAAPPVPGSESPPTTAPSPGATQPPATSSGGSPAAMTVSAPSHRVDVGQTLALSGYVTDEAGAALPDQPVVLQMRGPHRWRPVVQTTTDSTGLAAAVTPAITRSTRFRWHADRGVSSTPWLVRMVPSLTLSAGVGGSTTTISVVSVGTSAGDRFQLFRHVADRTALVRRGRLDASGAAAIAVVTPRRRATYAVRLLPTPHHAAARERVLVVPPAPANLAITGSAGRVGPGTTVTIVGSVTSASGAALPGHRVVLLRRGPARWRPVGHAVTDASGQVSIGTPAIVGTSRFRLRTDHHLASGVWRVVEVPTVSATASRSATTVAVSATTQGARPGDRVVLLRKVAGRLVRLRQGRLDADGSVGFVVKARRARTTYVVHLLATNHHAQARTSVTVPGS